jgi:hypothetical protein
VKRVTGVFRSVQARQGDTASEDANEPKPWKGCGVIAAENSPDTRGSSKQRVVG